MKKNKTNTGVMKGVTVGLLSGMLFALACAAAVSYLILNNIISLSALQVPAIGIMFLSAFIGNLFFSKISDSNNIFNGMLFTAIFSLVILILSVVLFDIPSLKLLYIVIASLFGSMMVCTKNIFPKKNKGYRKSRYG